MLNIRQFKKIKFSTTKSIFDWSDGTYIRNFSLHLFFRGAFFKKCAIILIMKKIFVLILILFFGVTSAMAINFGMYKPEEDYGLIDGFKINFGKERQKEGGKFIQLKTEMPEEKARMEKEKAKYEANKDQKADDEYQMFKFMLDDTIPF